MHSQKYTRTLTSHQRDQSFQVEAVLQTTSANLSTGFYNPWLKPFHHTLRTPFICSRFWMASMSMATLFWSPSMWRPYIVQFHTTWVFQLYMCYFIHIGILTHWLSLLYHPLSFYENITIFLSMAPTTSRYRVLPWVHVVPRHTLICTWESGRGCYFLMAQLVPLPGISWPSIVT